MNLGNVMILGDSFSTFEGYIPEGFATYYKNGGHENTDVTAVEQTWWKLLFSKVDANLILNSSYSGTTVCNTGYDKKDMKETSFLARMDKLIDNGWFKENKIDTLFIFGATNDSSAQSPMGEAKYGDIESEDLYYFNPAVCYLLDRIKKNLSNTRVIFITNFYIRDEYRETVKSACKHYEIEHYHLEEVGIYSSHPTIEGMKGIAEQIYNYLNIKGV